MAGERHGHGMLCVNRPLGYNEAEGKKTTRPAVAAEKAKLTTICHPTPTQHPPSPTHPLV